VARKTVSKSREVFVQNIIPGPSKIFKVKTFKVKVPWPVILHLTRKGTKNGIPYGTSVRQLQAKYSKKNKIIEYFKEKEIKAEVKQMSIEMSTFCPRCGKKGNPSIRTKNTDTRFFTNSRGESEYFEKHTVKGKNQPYWLMYTHTKRPPCWIQQWQGSEKGTFKNKKNKKFDLRKYRIANIVEMLSKEPKHPA